MFINYVYAVKAFIAIVTNPCNFEYKEKKQQNQVTLLASERDTLMGNNTIKNWGGGGGIYLFICVDARLSFCTLTFGYIGVSSVFDSTPNFTKQNPLV